MEKRVYAQIVDESEEEESESESESESSEEEAVFTGQRMFELYSVVINEIKGNHIHGRIIIEQYPTLLVIYDRHEDEMDKIGEPLLLRGTSEPFFASDPFSIFFDICPKELKPWHEPFSPDFFHGFKNKEIEEEGWGKVTLTYHMFFRAVKACVNVMFLGKDDGDGKKKYPSHVYGEIYATSDGTIDTKVVLFRKSKEEAEPVDNGEPIPLSKSVMAAELSRRLRIHVDLWGCYDSSYIQTSFIGSFKVRSYPCTEKQTPRYCMSPVQVKVTWEEPTEPRCGGIETLPSWKFDTDGRVLGELTFP